MQDIKENLIKRLEMLRGLPAGELDLQLTDIIDDLSSTRVKVQMKRSSPIPSPVPEHDSKRDGNYSSWLARNNID